MGRPAGWSDDVQDRRPPEKSEHQQLSGDFSQAKCQLAFDLVARVSDARGQEGHQDRFRFGREADGSRAGVMGVKDLD